ncbi:hypothetical protein BD309DRAFT_1046122 [Dichomitus squalens]|nr:hypothetical protein BD309DRAFT_1046122 [Dichomitus squalens]
MSELHSEHASVPPPLSNQARRVEKINGVLKAVTDNHWKSLNDFLIAFYTSRDKAIFTHSQRTITFSCNKVFPPERLLDAWLDSATGDTAHELRRTPIRKATDIMVEESTRACTNPSLHLSSTGIDVSDLKDNMLLGQLAKTFQTLLPCLWLLLMTLLTAANAYEKKTRKVKVDKDPRVSRIAVVMISMLLYGRNCGTNVFQFVMGLFLSSTGASRRVIDTFNHMGLSVSYITVQCSLGSMSESAKRFARTFVSQGEHLFGIIYDNINYTLRKASQQLDNLTEQLNATTSAVFAFPAKFTRAAYAAALSVAERNRRAGHSSPSISTKAQKPRLRVISSSQTTFYPLSALAQEEASVSGTIKVVTKIFRDLLNLAEEVIDAELRLLVGDWLSIQNLRLMREEVRYELTLFARMGWVQEASMPFHFQLNAMYMLYCTHLGHPGDQDPGALHHHCTLLRRSKLDSKKPEYNKAEELVEHSLIARVLNCARVLLKFKTVDDFKTWYPTWDEFDSLVVQLVDNFTMSGAAESAMFASDEVLAHSILFIRDALLFREFGDAIRWADVGRMWMVYDFWVFMMRGAGCHNYGNKILEMKAQFEHEFPLELREVVERTWLVNRWGKKGRSIPTDLYLEHNNSFLKAKYVCSAGYQHVNGSRSEQVVSMY